MTDQSDDFVAGLEAVVQKMIQRGMRVDMRVLDQLEQLTRPLLADRSASSNLSDSDLEALLYHGLSSGTATPAFVRDRIVKVVQELQERRAREQVARKVAEAYDSLGDGPITDEQIDNMLRWDEEVDLPIYAQAIGPRAARELRAHRSATLSLDDIEALRDARGSVAGSPHQGMTPGEQRRALDALDKILAGKGKL